LCIDTQLWVALEGDVKRGLFFRGSERLPFGSEIRPVKDLLHYLLTGQFLHKDAAGGAMQLLPA
jgi:nitronate monooxygenase